MQKERHPHHMCWWSYSRTMPICFYTFKLHLNHRSENCWFKTFWEQARQIYPNTKLHASSIHSYCRLQSFLDLSPHNEIETNLLSNYIISKRRGWRNHSVALRKVRLYISWAVWAMTWQIFRDKHHLKHLAVLIFLS